MKDEIESQPRFIALLLHYQTLIFQVCQFFYRCHSVLEDVCRATPEQNQIKSEARKTKKL